MLCTLCVSSSKCTLHENCVLWAPGASCGGGMPGQRFVTCICWRQVASAASRHVFPRLRTSVSAVQIWTLRITRWAFQDQEPTAQSGYPLGCPVHRSDTFCQMLTMRRELHRLPPFLLPTLHFNLHPRSSYEPHRLRNLRLPLGFKFYMYLQFFNYMSSSISV